MSINNNLKPLVWHNDSALSAIHSYTIRTVESGDAVAKAIGGKYHVEKIRLQTQTKETVTGFSDVEQARAWCFGHYFLKMRPYEPTTLAEAVNMLIDACYGASSEAGWWHDLNTGEPLQRNKGEMIALIHSEVSEALEGVRKGINDDHLPQYPMEDVEMADALIRIFDYIGGHGLQSANALVDKLAYNANRADHKIENRKKDGGKKL